MNKIIARIAWQIAKLEMSFRSLKRREIDRDGIIVVATTFMGDFVMTIPLIERVIRDSKQGVDVAVRRGNLELARNIYGVRNVYVLEKSYQSWSELKKTKGWNIGILALDNKWVRLLKGAGCDKIIGFECEENKWNDLINIKILPSSGAKYLRDWVQELWPSDGKYTESRNVALSYKDSIGPALSEKEEGCVFVQLGAGTSSRTWPYDKYKAVILWLARRGERVLLSGGDKERKVWENLLGDMSGEGDIKLIAGKCSRNDELRLLKYSKLYFGPDTGMTHMARLIGVPVVCLMGPSQLEVFSYAGEGNHDIYVSALMCRDKKSLFGIPFNGVQTCGRSTCPVKGWPCMTVEPEVVIKEIESILIC